MKTLLKTLRKGVVHGVGIFVGLLSSALLAVTINGAIKTWNSGETLTAVDLNTTIQSLQQTIEGIANWSAQGNNAIYMDGNVGIGTPNPTAALEINGGIKFTADGSTISKAPRVVTSSQCTGVNSAMVPVPLQPNLSTEQTGNHCQHHWHVHISAKRV